MLSRMSCVRSCRSGNPFSPSLVRVGLKVHHSVEKLALDTVVRARLAASATARAAYPGQQSCAHRLGVVQRATRRSLIIANAGSSRA